MNQINVGPVMGGKELRDAGGGFADVTNPATGEVIAREACADESAVGRIVESSAKAFHSTEWQRLTPADRGRLLLRLADLVEKHAEELTELELLDVGKPVSQLRGAEIPLTE